MHGLNFPFFMLMMKAFKAEAGSRASIESDGQNSATKQTADVTVAPSQLDGAEPGRERGRHTGHDRDAGHVHAGQKPIAYVNRQGGCIAAGDPLFVGADRRSNLGNRLPNS